MNFNTMKIIYNKSTINILLNEMLKNVFSEIENNIEMATLINSI